MAKKRKVSKRKTPTGTIPPQKVAPSPKWTLDAGISYSLLSKFVNCRERFRLYAVEGAREEKSKYSMEWGSYFHELLELAIKFPKASAMTLSRKCKVKLPRNEKLVARTVMERYLWWYSESKYTYFAAEDVFDVSYRLPNGRTVRLVGKVDGIIKRPDGSLWIKENKTKGNINEYKIESSIPFDLQTLFYATAINIKYNRPVTGVVYDVVRNPSHKPKNIKLTAAQKKAGEKVRKETTEEFVLRLDQEIEQNPKHFFMRWEFELSKQHHERWRKMFFDPQLTQLCMWWDSVKHDPFSPWVDAEGRPNPQHYLRPFGIYDALTTGTGDYFDLITRNRKIGVSFGNECFSELPELKKR